MSPSAFSMYRDTRYVISAQLWSVTYEVPLVNYELSICFFLMQWIFQQFFPKRNCELGFQVVVVSHFCTLDSSMELPPFLSNIHGKKCVHKGSYGWAFWTNLDIMDIWIPLPFLIFLLCLTQTIWVESLIKKVKFTYYSDFDLCKKIRLYIYQNFLNK